MMELNLDECYEEAIKLAKTAGQMLKCAISKSKSVSAKSHPKDLVTETDLAIERLIMTSLASTFPAHKFIGEESTSSGVKFELTDSPTWIVDPIDGTMNFVHGFPFACVSVGLWAQKQAQIGVVYNPLLEQMFTARRGRGAFLNGEQIRVSGQKDLSQALVITELGTRHGDDEMRVMFDNQRAIFKEAHGTRSLGSAALNLCLVASGGADAYYEIGIHAWDVAAGALVVAEAGGCVVDVDGVSPLDVLSRRVLAAASPQVARRLASLIQVFDQERD